MTFKTDIYGFLERCEAYDLSSFGGLDAVLRSGSEIASSSVPELFIDLVLPHLNERTADVEVFLADVVENVESDSDILTIADRLAGNPLSTEHSSNRIFKRFSALFTDHARSASLRSAALKGAYLTAIGHPNRLARLGSRIIEIEDEPETAILPSAARVAGLILANFENDGLVYFLHTFEMSDFGGDQIKLELGLLQLKKALTASDQAQAFTCLDAAKDYFQASYDLRSTRHEAKAFSLAIGILLDFAQGKSAEDIDHRISELRQAAWAYDAYVTQGITDPLLGAVASQKSAFATLAIRLSKLAKSMSEKTWLYAASVIEEQLLVAYTANATVLFGDKGVGVDLLLRPPIEASLLGNHMFTAAMEQWLDMNAHQIDGELTEDIRAFMGGRTRYPTDADADNRTASALLTRTTGLAASISFGEILQFRHEREIRTTSPFVVSAFETIETSFRHLEDFKNAAIRYPFMDLASAMVTFAAGRIDSSYEQNKQTAYLFANRNENPLEKDLQQDFKQWCDAKGIKLDYEPIGIAGGRADLRYEENSARFIVEVKQEQKDASFTGLISSYGSQTAQYQATNVRLGGMLVLDKTRPRQPPERIDDIYKPMVVEHLGHLSGVLVVKVAALRATPSEASR